MREPAEASPYPRPAGEERCRRALPRSPPDGAAGRFDRTANLSILGHARLVSPAWSGRAPDVLGVLRRLGARCARCADLQFRDPRIDRGLEHHQGAGRIAGDQRVGDFRLRRLDRRHVRRPRRPGATAQHHDRMVRVLHLSVRLHPEFRAIACRARLPGFWLRGRMGGRLGVDGRSGSRRRSRQGGGHGAERVGRWAGAPPRFWPP